MNWSRLVSTFEREAQLLSRCNHPNIVQCLGCYRSDVEVALVLSLAPNGDCQQLLQRHGALAERAATGIAEQMCAALEHLHTAALCLHRDVKLENVLVVDLSGHRGGTPRVQLCDLGHSCCLTPPHVEGTAPDDGFRGTKGYTAPEVLAGHPWTVAADGWGLGVVYYALLANELLRWKHNAPDISTKTSRAFAHVTPECKMRIKALLSPDPRERQTLAPLLGMLRLALDHPPASPRDASSLCGFHSSVASSPRDSLSAPAPSDAEEADDDLFGGGGGPEPPSASLPAASPAAAPEASLRRSDAACGLMRKAYSVSSNLYALGSSSTAVGVGRVDPFSSCATSASANTSPSISKNSSVNDCASLLAHDVTDGMAGGLGGGDAHQPPETPTQRESVSPPEHTEHSRVSPLGGMMSSHCAGTASSLSEAGQPPGAAAMAAPALGVPLVAGMPPRPPALPMSSATMAPPPSPGIPLPHEQQQQSQQSLSAKSQRTAKLLAALQRAQYT